MNRKERRAAAKHGAAHIKTVAGGPATADAAALFAQAQDSYRQGRQEPAKAFCKQVLAINPAHVPALNLLGLVYQASGEHRRAIKTLENAVQADDLNPACHYNLASSYLALERRQDAGRHFNRSIALGMSENIEDFILQNPTISRLVANIDVTSRAGKPISRSPKLEDLEIIFDDLLFRCALESAPLRGLKIESLLSQLRREMLDQVSRMAPDAPDAPGVAFYGALAQQCFLNEYVFDETARETAQIDDLRRILENSLQVGEAIPPMQLVAAAAYRPLHTIRSSRALLQRKWTSFVDALVTQQIREPLAEFDDHSAIPALTTIDDTTSIEVMEQYAENPYPRWSSDPSLARVPEASNDDTSDVADILIAGCGTGRHACHVARQFPNARILAVDLSFPSLAYARRKTRDAFVNNIEYAQADILKLGSLGQSFDRIESVGVLHHLSSPEAGFNILLSLLRRPAGQMRIGLYSETARREIVNARRLISERGYRATPKGIRQCRADIIRERETGLWNRIIGFSDFYTMSGCRDLLFNVMEQRFTIERIRALLSNAGVSFAGFDLDAATSNAFRQQYPAPEAWRDLASWQKFEAAHPDTFRQMYVFNVELS